MYKRDFWYELRMKARNKVIISGLLLLFPLAAMIAAYWLEGGLGKVTLALSLGYLGGLLLSVPYFVSLAKILLRRRTEEK